MLLSRLVTSAVAVLRFAAAVDVVGAAIGVPEPVKIWSILQFLIRGEDRKILPDLYAFVTKLDESELELDCLECDLTTEVGEILVTEYAMDDIASLLPIYADLYPMGLPRYAYDASGSTYFVLNGKRYNKPDDVFYLKSKELQAQAKMDDSEIVRDEEVVIGTNPKAPIVILYGCPDDEEKFEEFNRNLYAEASTSGKLRYLWRPVCSLSESSINGMPLGLTGKTGVDASVLPTDSLSIPEDFKEVTPIFHELNEEDLAGIDLKVAALIAQHYSECKDFHSTLEYAKGIINNFPLLTKNLASLEISTSKVLRSNEKLKLDGIDYGMLGLYVNGQNWRLSEADRFNLINAITHEYYAIKRLESVLQCYDDVASLMSAKRLLQVFSDISLSKLDQNQPIKIDLHRIPGFSEAIIYFNDIEADGQYEELGTDIKSFFEDSKFGELPDFRQNWNEVIFVIDFGNLDDENTKVALEGLNRAIKVIAQGYPQRVGLLPINTGGGEGLIHKIYKLKNTDLFELAEFLENNPSNSISTRYPRTPDYSSLAEDLQIRETSIIINGEIYPFKKNTWHYLIAKTIKKDKAYVTKQLSKVVTPEQKHPQQINVRDILHAKSTNTRNKKYTPDYFVDATYTSVNNAALKSIDDSIIEYVKSEKYVILHTITLVDDFGTSGALKRLKNLLNTGFLGVRIRVINNGLLTGGDWQNIRKIVNKFDMRKLDSLIDKFQNNKPHFASNHEALTQWLVDLAPEPFTKSPFLVINGRFIHLSENEVLTTNQLEAIIKREALRTLDTMHALEQIFPKVTEEPIDPDFIEQVSSALSKLFYQGTNIYNNGIDYTAEGSLPRMNLKLHYNDFTVFQSHDSTKPIDVTLFMDPTEERSQKFLSVLSLLERIPFVNLQIVLLPTQNLKISPINRIYLDAGDLEISDELVANFQLEWDTPANFYISNTNELDGVIIEVHAFKAGEPISEANIDGVGGACLKLIDKGLNVEANCITMATFGYGQFIARPMQDYTVQSCDPRYRVASIALNGRSDYLNSRSVPLLDLNKVKVHVELQETGLLAEPANDQTLHIFTVLKDNGQDQDKAEKMISTILSQTAETTRIQFWILDQPFLTDSFRQFCHRASNTRGSVQFVKYSWPPWLRPQRLSDKRLDLYKILFLDVMFPLDVSRIVYMEPDPAPLDPLVLYNQHTSNAPFALFEATGPGYWQQGYWAKKLQDSKTRFHAVKPAFVVDLAELRRLHGGDALRVHYQRLSTDFNSLANTHQDLINDLQLSLPIATLAATASPHVTHDEL